jgi:hypothetical protein
MATANTFQFVDWVAAESLRMLLNRLVYAQFASHEYEKEYERTYAVGETVRVKLPQRWLVTNGLAFQPQPINRIYTTVSVNQIFGIHFQVDSLERALKMERGREWFKKEYIDKQMAKLANEIDRRFALFAMQNTSNIVGQLGVDPTSMTTFLQARQRLIEQGCPQDGEWGMIYPPSVGTSLIPSLASFFNPTSEISRQYKRGSMGKMVGFDWYESVNNWRQTAGTQAGTNTVAGANQQGSQLTINATAGDTYAQGDIFEIANVNAVNPENLAVISTAQGKEFVVTQAITCVGGGADVLNISPAIFGPGSQYQNVDSLPANAAALTSYPGTVSPNGKSSAQGLALTKDAYAMVGVELDIPKACEWSGRATDPETGISVALLDMFDPIERKRVCRADVLLGFGALYPDNCAVRIACS